MRFGRKRPTESIGANVVEKRVWWLTKLLFALGLLYFALKWFEWSQTYQPSRRVVSSIDTISPDGLEFQVLSGGRYQVQAWLLPAARGAAYQDWLVIFAHGNAGNISHRQSFYQTWLHLGFNVLAFDYRGYGASEGRPSESGTYEDLRSVLDWALKNGFPQERILLLGKSLGGGVASEVAGDGNSAGLILHSTFTSIPDIGAELFPFLPVRWLATILHDTYGKLHDLQQPVLILHSRSDSLISFHHAERNYSAAQSPKWLFEISGDHNDDEWERVTSLEPAVTTFMRHLTLSQQ